MFLCLISETAKSQISLLNKQIDSLENALSKAKGPERNAILIEYGYALNIKDTCESIKILNKGIEGAIGQNQHSTVIRGYYLLLHVFNSIGKRDSAISISRKKIAYALKFNYLKEAAYSYNELAKFFLNQKDFDSTSVHLKNAEKIFFQISDNGGLGDVYDKLGLMAVMQGNYKEANSFYDKALNYVQNSDSTYLIGLVTYHLGFSFFQTSDYELALIRVHKALEIWENLDNIGLAPRWNCLEMLGNIYLKVKRFDLALEYHRKALAVRKLGWDGVIADSLNLSYAYSYNNIAETYFLMNRLDSAYWYADQSLKIKLRPATLASNTDIANSYLNTAKIILALGQIQQAEKYAERSLYYYISANWKDGVAESHLLLAKIYRKMVLQDKEMLHLNEVISITESTGAKLIQKQAWREMADLLLSQKKYKESNEALMKFRSLNDSIFSEDMNKRIAEMNVKYETEKKELENTFLHEQNTSQKKIKLYLFWALGLFVAFALTLAGVVMLLRKNLTHKNDQLSRQKQIAQLIEIQHQRDIEFKNLELQMLMGYIKSKNDMLETIRTVMLDEIKSNCNAPVETFQRTVQTIQSHLVSDQDWDMVDKQIEKLSSGFTSSLFDKHPNLTTGDLKLCAFIRLHLSTREIASILNITEESVHKHRYRLRKKLHLNGDSLEGYLSEL
jgi:tetratricopeptide (TPR) repeat protein